MSNCFLLGAYCLTDWFPRIFVGYKFDGKRQRYKLQTHSFNISCMEVVEPRGKMSLHGYHIYMVTQTTLQDSLTLVKELETLVPVGYLVVFCSL